MKRLLIIILITFITSANAKVGSTPLNMMGDGVGNGGDVAYCDSTTDNNFDGIYTLDYLLTFQKRNNNEDVDGIVKNSWTDYSDEILLKFRDLHPEMAVNFEDFIADTDNYTDESKFRIWRDASHGLIDIQDEAMFKKLPANCQTVQQAVIRIDYGYSIEYFMDTIVQAQLLSDPLQYSMLMMHEFARDYTNDTRVIRRFVRYMHSKSFLENDEITSEQFSRILKKMTIIKEEVIVNSFSQEELDANLLKDFRLNNIEYIKKWLKLGADPMARDEQSNTILINAVESNNIELVKLAIELGVYLDSVNVHNENALMMASSNGNIEIAQLLIDNGADVFFKQPNSNYGILEHAVHEQKIEFAKYLLQNYDLDTSSSEVDYSPIIYHVIDNSRDYELIQELISHGSDINEIYYGSTYLSQALGNGYIAHAKKLISLGANVNQLIEDYFTPFSSYISNHENESVNLDFVDYLIEQGGEVNNPLLGHSVLYQTINNSRLFEHLVVRCGADVNFKSMHSSDDGKTILMMAIEDGNEFAIKKLLTYGADPSITDNSLNTVLHIFAQLEEHDIDQFNIILEMNVDKSAKNRNGKTAYDVAVENNLPQEFIQKLIP